VQCYVLTCANQDHVLTDYVSLYLDSTYNRRITFTKHPDTLQLNLDFINSKSEISILIHKDDYKEIRESKVEFNYLIEDNYDVETLLEKLEVYQIFS
jgi:hypothetical protein